MWQRVSGIAGKKWLTDKSPHYLDSLEDLHMHTWLATGLMGRVIRSRRTLALVAVMAIFAFALPAMFAQQAQTAAPTSTVAATTSATTQETAPATPAHAKGEADLTLPDMKSVSFLG